MYKKGGNSMKFYHLLKLQDILLQCFFSNVYSEPSLLSSLTLNVSFNFERLLFVSTYPLDRDFICSTQLSKGKTTL